MNHIAIMKKTWGLTQKILAGEKTIETRWYKNKVKPWDQVFAGDKIYFKDTGEPVTVQAEVSKVEQFENLDENKIEKILNMYSKKEFGITEIENEIAEHVKNKNYCILVHIKNPKSVEPFGINKTGFGVMSAWICVENLNQIKV